MYLLQLFDNISDFYQILYAFRNVNVELELYSEKTAIHTCDIYIYIHVASVFFSPKLMLTLASSPAQLKYHNLIRLTNFDTFCNHQSSQ